MIWKVLLVAVVAAGLAACSRAGTAPEGPSASPGAVAGAAQGSDPRAQEIQAYRAAAAQFAADEIPVAAAPDQDLFYPDDQNRLYLDLVDCDATTEADLSGREPTALEFVAKRAAVLKRKLRAAGYRAAAFDGVVDSYEQRKLAQLDLSAPAEQVLADMDADMAELSALAAQLDAVRSEASPQLPPVRADGGCGGGEGPAMLRTEPSGARIWLISKFAFDVCRIKGVDPWSPARCERWTEVEPNKVTQLSGRYVYTARWADGRESRGSREIQPGVDTLQTYILR